MMAETAAKGKDDLAKGVESYRRIMKWRYSGTPLTEEIEDIYFRFYGLHHRGRHSAWTEAHFALLERWRADGKDHFFGEAVDAMYEVRKSVETSFCSKLIHTLDPSMPIYDSIVCGYLSQERAGGIDIRVDHNPNRDAQRKDAKVKYGILFEWYRDPRRKAERERLIRLFDAAFSNAGIAEAKKIDFAIWGGLWKRD